jgi:ribosomal subunit interface protein
MKLPLQITLRDIPQSEAVQAAIRKKAEKLEQVFDRIMGCRVLVEAPHRHHNKGVLYNVSVDVTVPGNELVVKREQHEDLYVAIRDAFDAARRQLKDYSERKRGRIKHHEVPPHARVVRLVPEESYGFLLTPDQREVYFHANSVLNDGFKALGVGSEVRFVEEMGDEGPQATTVAPIGKHHLHA